MFNGHTFHAFLKQSVTRYAPRKVFMIIDNAPWHRLQEDGKEWLKANKNRIELFRLPSYSPEFMPMEGVWKQTRKMTTHNTFYTTVGGRDTALRQTFSRFQRRPGLISPQVARFL